MEYEGGYDRDMRREKGSRKVLTYRHCQAEEVNLSISFFHETLQKFFGDIASLVISHLLFLNLGVWFSGPTLLLELDSSFSF